MTRFFILIVSITVTFLISGCSDIELDPDAIRVEVPEISRTSGEECGFTMRVNPSSPDDDGFTPGYMETLLLDFKADPGCNIELKGFTAVNRFSDNENTGWYVEPNREPTEVYNLDNAVDPTHTPWFDGIRGANLVTILRGSDWVPADVANTYAVWFDASGASEEGGDCVQTRIRADTLVVSDGVTDFTPSHPSLVGRRICFF